MSDVGDYILEAKLIYLQFFVPVISQTVFQFSTNELYILSPLRREDRNITNYYLKDIYEGHNVGI